MNSLNKRKFMISTIALAATLASANVLAQTGTDWPTRPVNIVVGFSAGGPTDAVARILAEQLSNKFGQSFVIENRAGAGGGVAAAQVKKAAPDGYTLMFGSSGTLSVLPNLKKDLPYDPIKDFTPVGLVASYPYFLVTSSSSPLTSLDALIKMGRDPASKLSYASAGNGAVNHLAGEWFKNETKIKAVHIPYKGDSAAVADLLAGRVDFAFLAGAAALPHVKSGKLRMLASASAVPGRGGDGVPTIGVSLIKGFAAEPWNGVMAPAGLPQPIVTKLNAAINEIMNRKDIVERLAAMEQYPLTGTPQQFSNHIKEQTDRWATVIKTADIKSD